MMCICVVSSVINKRLWVMDCVCVAVMQSQELGHQGLTMQSCFSAKKSYFSMKNNCNPSFMSCYVISPSFQKWNTANRFLSFLPSRSPWNERANDWASAASGKTPPGAVSLHHHAAGLWARPACCQPHRALTGTSSVAMTHLLWAGYFGDDAEITSGFSSASRSGWIQHIWALPRLYGFIPVTSGTPGAAQIHNLSSLKGRLACAFPADF